MKQRINLDRIWKAARNGAAHILDSAELHVQAWPTDCPLSLDDLLATEFYPRRSTEAMAAIRHAGRNRG